MNYSPSSNEFDDIFASETICIDEDIKSINPDEFLNLEEFEIKHESSTYYNHSQQLFSQLTPPISPSLDNHIYQHIRLIPIAAFPCNDSSTTPQKPKVKQIVPKPSSSSDSDSNPNVLHVQPHSKTPADRAQIKQARLIRNREAANLSRKKQKEYLQTLEMQNVELCKENSFLKAENLQLKEKLRSYSVLSCRCASSISRKLPSKNTTMMLALLLMVGVNVVPFGNMMFSSKIQNPISSSQQLRTPSRHLLFVENSTSTSNETIEIVEPETIYFNQTDHVRKVNIENIRRWIPEPDGFNISKRNSFEFDPLQAKLTKMYEKARENKETKKRPPKKRSVIGPTPQHQPVQLYNVNSIERLTRLNEFFDEINRKDDVFYVFSFKSDHLLLPADNSLNFSQIKMNLIMPRNNGE